MNEKEITQSYLEGKSILQLSKESGISYRKIQNIVKKIILQSGEEERKKPYLISI